MARNKIHECVHEDDFQRIQKEHDELMKIAGTHVTWTTYWSITLVLIGLTTGVISYIINEKHAVHDELKGKIERLETSSTDAKVIYTQIQTQLVSIQKDLNELKTTLKEHDK